MNITPRPLPHGYTLDEAEAHLRGWRQGIEAARRACQIVHDTAPDMAACQTARRAIAAIDAIPAPGIAKPKPKSCLTQPRRHRL